jgi:hypothetical protein
MNTKEQAIKLATKATDNLDKKKGVFTLTFFDDTKKEVRVLNINSNLDKDGFSCVLTTFTNDINNTTRYDIYDLKDIN